MLIVYWRGLRALSLHAGHAVSSAITSPTGTKIVAINRCCASHRGVCSTGHPRASSTSAAGGDDHLTKSEGATAEHPDEAALTSSVPLLTQESGLPWLNIRAGILGHHDRRVPLPGDVGTLQPLPTTHKIAPLPPAATLQDMDTLLTSSSTNMQEVAGLQNDTGHFRGPRPENLLECKALPCPKLLIKDLATLFPSRPGLANELTAVTLAQRTEHDMAGWSELMETEREVLLKQFVEAALSICSALSAEGFWADFVDPSSGRPYYGDYTSDTLFETDDRYRYLGFKIEDLGCCKVVSHRIFGTHVFVGAIFTSAPAKSEILEDILNWHNSRPAPPAGEE